MDELAAIRRLYFQATARTIVRDLERAVALLSRIESADARERAAVYMDGLSQMRSEWASASRRGAGARRKSR